MFLLVVFTADVGGNTVKEILLCYLLKNTIEMVIFLQNFSPVKEVGKQFGEA